MHTSAFIIADKDSGDLFPLELGDAVGADSFITLKLYGYVQ